MDKLTTYGATRAKLIANGYAPCSATAPGARGYKITDDPGAILCAPQHEDNALPDADDRTLAAIIVTVQDKELRAEVIATLAKHGLAGGPCRIASDGSAAYVMRFDGPDLALSNETVAFVRGDDPAVVLAGCERTGNPEKIFVSDLIRLDGEWKGGSPLTVARKKLPTLDRDTLRQVWIEIDRAVTARAEAPPEMPKHLADHYAAGVYKRMDFAPPTMDPIAPPPTQEKGRWYDGFSREWVDKR